MACELGADIAVSHSGWQKGSEGALRLAEAVVEAAEMPVRFKRLYDKALSIEEKVFKVAKKIYGAESTDISTEAAGNLKRIQKWGFGHQGLCIAKTHLSLSHDSRLKSVPEGYTLPIVDFVPFAGAGYVCALTEQNNLMPGMPRNRHGVFNPGKRRAL